MGWDRIQSKTQIEAAMMERVGINDPDEVAAQMPVQVFDSDNLEVATDGYQRSSAGYEKAVDDFVNAIEAEQLKDAIYPGDQLKEFLDKNIKDEQLRAEIDGYIEQIMAAKPENYEKMHTNGKNKVFDEILEVYIRDEIKKAEIELMNYIMMDQSPNFSMKIENIRQGQYTDKDGIQRSLGITSSAKDGVHVYPANSYQSYALKTYAEEIMPTEMERKLRAALMKLEADGKLNERTLNEDFVNSILEAAGLRPGSDPMFEQYVENRSKDVAKLIKRHDKVMKRREELKHVTEEEINNKLKKSTLKSIERYMRAHKNEDGTYDLSELSVAIEYRSGKDYLVNRSKDYGAAEREMVRCEFAALEGFDVRNFDKENGNYRQTEDLIDFCGYAIQNRDHTPSIVKAAKGLVDGMVVGAATHCIAPNVRTIVLHDVVNVNNIVTVDTGLTVETAEQLIQVISDVKVDIPMCYNLLNALAVSGVAGVVLSVLEDLIFGNDIEFEMSCFTLNDYDIHSDRYTNKEKYVEYLSKSHPQQYQRIKFLLDKFPADDKGNWDHAEFFNLLRTIAGLGSNLNCAEIAGMKMYPDKVEPPKPQPAEKKVYKAKEEVQYNIVTPDKTIVVNEEDLPEGDRIIFNKQAKGSGWDHLVSNIYDCNDDGKSLSDVFGPKKAKRILKIAQAVTDGDYSLERMNQLYELSLKGSSALKNIDGIDYGVYYSVLIGNFPHELKLPKEICYKVDSQGNPIPNSGIVRCDISNDEHELRLGYKLTEDQLDRTLAPAKGPAKGKVVKVVKGVRVQGGATLYYLKDEDGIHTFSDKEEWEAAVKAAEERVGGEAIDVRLDKLNKDDPEADD